MQKWSLELEEATTYDSGNYTCTASNAYGSVSFTYKLLIQGKPRFFVLASRLRNPGPLSCCESVRVSRT